jgi:hypothetical protein
VRSIAPPTAVDVTMLGRRTVANRPGVTVSVTVVTNERRQSGALGRSRYLWSVQRATPAADLLDHGGLRREREPPLPQVLRLRRPLPMAGFSSLGTRRRQIGSGSMSTGCIQRCRDTRRAENGLRPNDKEPLARCQRLHRRGEPSSDYGVTNG